MEAERLSIYFEEYSAHQYRQSRKSNPSNNRAEEITELELKDDDYDDPNWWKRHDEDPFYDRIEIED